MKENEMLFLVISTVVPLLLWETVVLKERWSFIRGTVSCKVKPSDHLGVVLNTRWSLKRGITVP